MQSSPGEWDELLRGARLAVVAVTAAVVTALGVIGAGRALMPVEVQTTADSRLVVVADR